MSDRKLATIRRISELKPIEGADKIELAIIDGWQSVVKKGEYNVGDLVVYLEVDSWVPHGIAPFLTKSGHLPKIYQGVEGQRLKSIKLKGEISQGLLLNIELMSGTVPEEGSDVTDFLGILKWEKEIPANLRGVQRGNFPTEVYKTDQERIQNLANKLEEFKQYTWEVTEKLHGSSMTIYVDSEDVMHVCSRNIDLVETEDNTYWQVARKIFDEAKINAIGYDMYKIAIQGELVGPGINGNQYDLTEADFYLFDMQQVAFAKDRYAPGFVRRDFAKDCNIKHTPVIDEAFVIPSEWTVQDLLTFAEGASKINASEREGLVFKCNENPEISFKVVSNKWLLKGGEDQ